MSSRPTVLLINPNRMKPAVGPLGLDYLADALWDQGFAPVIVDLAFLAPYRSRLETLLRQRRPVAVGITVRNLDDCYFDSQAFLLGPIQRLVRWLKSRTPAPIVLGGVGYSIAPLAALRLVGADLGLRGDGEAAFPQMLAALLAGTDFSRTPGLVRPEGQVNPRAEADLLQVPRGTRRWLNNARYFREGGQGNLETKRGCDQQCIYCADPVAKGRRLRTRPAEAVVAEVKLLLKQGVNVFHLCDSEFNLPRTHAEAVCRAILRHGLERRMKWYAYASPRPFDRDLARLMAAAGCVGINFGVDSASDEQLERLGRGHRSAEVGRAIQACRRAGITVMCDLLVAGPGETRATLRETILRLKEWKPDRVGVSLGVRIFPGTRLARMIQQAGPLEENPHLHGRVSDNPEFLFPIFYVERALGRNPEEFLHRLIGDDPRFFFASRRIPERNYNYNNNRVLLRAIREGGRGAYWDLLRRGAETPS